jgi:hypothetical protein
VAEFGSACPYIGSHSVIRRCLLNVRFGSPFGLKSDISRGPSCATIGCEQSQQNSILYSITSSAVASSDGGTVCIGHSAHAVRGHFPAHRFWKAGLKRARPKRGNRARSEGTKRPSYPANTDVKHMAVKRSSCKGGAALARHMALPDIL